MDAEEVPMLDKLLEDPSNTIVLIDAKLGLMDCTSRDFILKSMKDPDHIVFPCRPPKLKVDASKKYVKLFVTGRPYYVYLPELKLALQRFKKSRPPHFLFLVRTEEKFPTASQTWYQASQSGISSSYTGGASVHCQSDTVIYVNSVGDITEEESKRLGLEDIIHDLRSKEQKSEREGKGKGSDIEERSEEEIDTELALSKLSDDISHLQGIFDQLLADFKGQPTIQSVNITDPDGVREIMPLLENIKNVFPEVMADAATFLSPELKSQISRHSALLHVMNDDMQYAGRNEEQFTRNFLENLLVDKLRRINQFVKDALKQVREM